jgi:hypothetical protein
MNIDDGELPPLLVDTQTSAQDPEDGLRVRVPITIVTGRHRFRAYGIRSYSSVHYIRLSRRWQDYSA